MAEPLAALLRDRDPARRKAGITRLVRSEDPRATKILAHLQQHDPDASVRQLAQRALDHLHRTTASPTAHPTSTPTTTERLTPDKVLDTLELSDAQARPTPPLPALKQRPDPRRPDPRHSTAARQSKRSAYIRNLTIFALLCVVAGAAVLYVVAGDVFRQVFYEEALNDRIAHAEAFPFDGPAEDNTLDGRFFAGRINNRSGYYIQEPVGTAPEYGWPLIVAVHGSNSNGRTALSWIGRQAQDYGAILVTPSFVLTESGGFRFDSSADDLNLLLAELERYYPIDPQARMIFGFSGGGMFASSYTARYRYFNAASIGGSREFEMPAPSNPVMFIVVCGEEDYRSAAASRFSIDMAARGTPVWYYEIVPGLGHNIAGVQIDKTFELLDQLRG